MRLHNAGGIRTHHYTMRKADMNSHDDSLQSRVGFLVAEFNGLREEIKYRTTFQHSTMMILVAGYGSIGSSAVAAPDRLHLLVLLPILCLCMYSLWAVLWLSEVA